MELKLFTQFAANEYSCGAYGAGSYSESCATSTGGGGTSGDSGSSGASGGLADTGMNMILFLVIGVVLLAGSLLYLARTVMKARHSK